jgi:hypothetical protein
LAFLPPKKKKKVHNCFAQRTSTCLKRAYNLFVDPVPDPAGGHLYGVVPIPVKESSGPLEVATRTKSRSVGQWVTKAGGHSYMNYVDF